MDVVRCSPKGAVWTSAVTRQSAGTSAARTRGLPGHDVGDARTKRAIDCGGIVARRRAPPARLRWRALEPASRHGAESTPPRPGRGAGSTRGGEALVPPRAL